MRGGPSPDAVEGHRRDAVRGVPVLEAARAHGERADPELDVADLIPLCCGGPSGIVNCFSIFTEQVVMFNMFTFFAICSFLFSIAYLLAPSQPLFVLPPPE